MNTHPDDKTYDPMGEAIESGNWMDTDKAYQYGYSAGYKAGLTQKELNIETIRQAIWSEGFKAGFEFAKEGKESGIADTNDYIKRGDAIDAVNERIKQIGYEKDVAVLLRQAIREVPASFRAITRK